MAGECRRPAKANDLTKDPTTYPPARQRAHDSLRHCLCHCANPAR